MKRTFSIVMISCCSATMAYSQVDAGDCALAGSSLELCDPSGAACTTAKGLPGTCVQRPKGCQCLPAERGRSGGGRVHLCHREGENGMYRSIRVSNIAVAAHLRHGDCVIQNGGDPCNRQICHPVEGCISASGDEACNDRNACTHDECDPESGGCAHSPIECDDDNECTVDRCHPKHGCVHRAFCETDADCDEGPCVIATCVDGCTCVALPACTATIDGCRNVTGECVEETGECVEENEEDGTPCNIETGSTACDAQCDGVCSEGACEAAP